MFMSKHQDAQKILFGEIVFDNDFRKIRKIQDDVIYFLKKSSM